MKNISYPVLITDQSVLVLKGGKRLVANSQRPCFNKIIDAVKRGAFNNIERLFEVKNTVEKVYGLTVKNNQVYYRNKPISNVLSDMVINYMRNNYNHKPLCRFINRLLERNPSKISVEQLWEYVSRYQFPLDSDGCFYATKCVANNWMDKYTGKIKNRVGADIKMDRKLVSTENTGSFCSSEGLYCGALKEYVLGYYGGGNDRVIVVKVKPEDVCAVASDHNYAKIRCCRYVVTNYLGTVEELKDTDLVEFTHKTVGIKRNKLGQFC